MPTEAEILTVAARDALHAPSALNTQPWTWYVRRDGLELYADRDRQLTVADPEGRLLLLNCGIALHHARVSLAATGYAAAVRHLVETFDDNLLARLQLGQDRPATTQDRAMRVAVERRRTDRRPFGDRPVPEGMLAALVAAAESEGARLHIARLGQTPMLAIAVAQAGAAEISEPDYRLELMRWTNRPQWSGDGVPPEATVQRAPRRVPVRELALEPNAGQPVESVGDRGAAFLVLYGQTDSAAAWFAAGEAASNVLLTATTFGLATEPISDAIEVSHPRDLIAGLLPGGGCPYLIIRTGWSNHARPDATGGPALDPGGHGHPQLKEGHAMSDQPNVLVTYGTKNGSTAGIAEIIAEELRADGLNADVREAGSVHSLDGYEAVVVGGALYAGRWHRAARRFVRRHAEALRERSVWLFSSGPLDDSADRSDIPPVRQVAAAATATNARGHATFGGCLTEAAKGFLARAMVRNGRGGDFRSPERIQTWAKEISHALR